MATFSFRAPERWAGQLDSGRVRGWLQEYFRHPQPLPPDPGAGPSRLSLSLPERAVKVLEGLSGDSASGALRRLIAAHITSLAIVSQRPTLALSGPRGGTELSTTGLKRRVDSSLLPQAQEEPHMLSLYPKELIQVSRSDEAVSPIRPMCPVTQTPDWSQLPRVPPWFVCVVVAILVVLVWWLLRARRQGGEPPGSGAAAAPFKPWIPKV